MVEIVSAEAGKARVDKPETVGSPSHFVDVDISSDVHVAGEIAGIVFANGLEFGGHIGDVAKFPNARTTPDRHPASSVGCQSHWLLEQAKMGIQDVPIGAHQHHLARLVGGDCQGHTQLLEELRKIGGMDTP